LILISHRVEIHLSSIIILLLGILFGIIFCIHGAGTKVSARPCRRVVRVHGVIIFYIVSRPFVVRKWFIAESRTKNRFGQRLPAIVCNGTRAQMYYYVVVINNVCGSGDVTVLWLTFGKQKPNDLRSIRFFSISHKHTRTHTFCIMRVCFGNRFYLEKIALVPK